MTEPLFQTKQQSKQALDARHSRTALRDDRATVQAAKLVDGRTAQRAQQPNNTGLPDNLKSGIESLSGMSMDSVQVHYNSSKPAQLNAHAYAQGTNIHVAPGQEKQLPHEAWHVVQQAQGRVRPTMQMKAGMPVNNDQGLEHEADVMGALAERGAAAQDSELLQGQAQANSHAPLQRQSVQQAGLLGGYAANPDINLYNARGGIGLPHGTLYSVALPAVPAVGGTAAVLDAYMLATRPYAGPLAARQFLDARKNPPAPPSPANWGADGANYIATIEGWLMAPAETLAAMAPPGGTQANAGLFGAGLVNNRNALRNTAAYGLVDPFIAQITIPVAGAAAPWIIQTNFSHASFGYIIDIDVGPHNVHGHIATSVDAFNAISAQIPAAGVVHHYSPGHDDADQTTVGAQMATVAPGATHGANHLGLDAVTKLAAEGARFEPVRQLGTHLKFGSRFFAMDYDAHHIQYLDFRTLYQRWGHWFGRAYAIPSADVRREVLAHGEELTRPLDLPSDYDTDAATPAQNQVGHYTASIQAELQIIREAEQKKLRYARGKGPRKQAAVAAYNRGQNQIIDNAKYRLSPYQAMMPHIVHNLRHPPPVIVVVPAAEGVGVGAEAAVGGLAQAPANNNGLRQILVKGVLVTTVVAALVAPFLFGPNGLLSGDKKT